MLHSSLKPTIAMKMILRPVFSLINLGLDKTSIVNFSIIEFLIEYSWVFILHIVMTNILRYNKM